MDPTDTLRRRFGYPGFRPGQEDLVRAVLAGRDALGILPTGGGKSVCYQVPAFLLSGLTLVISPLISLMGDQVRRARAAGLEAALLNSTQSRGEREAVLASARAGRLRLLLVAPERLETPSFRDALAGIPVSLVAVDEAHCIAEWGQDFRPSYRRIGALREAVSAPLIALTATATPAVREEIARSLRLEDPVRVVGSFDRPNLRWHVLPVSDERGRWETLARLVRGAAGAVVVYAGTRRMVESLRDRLAGLGLPVEAYHAGLLPAERARVQAAFMEGERRVVVATNAFGMGVDKADVRLVVHWQMPGTLEAYYQEAGRGGRDGEPALCVALVGRRDEDLHRGFVDRARPDPRVLERVLARIRERIPAGERGPLAMRALARGLGRGWNEEAAEGALVALVAAGAVRLLGEPERQGPDGAVFPVGVHSGIPDLERARVLRLAALAKLAGVATYARARSCRRAALLGYFGEATGGGPCGGCDRCGAPRLDGNVGPAARAAWALRRLLHG